MLAQAHPWLCHWSSIWISKYVNKYISGDVVLANFMPLCYFAAACNAVSGIGYSLSKFTHDQDLLAKLVWALKL